VVFAWALLGGVARGQSKTVPGPEVKNLLPATAGYLLTNQLNDAITAIQLPSLKETVVRPSRKDPNDRPIIHALSGPDAEGRIAYIEDHEERHLLKTIKLDGTQDTEFFSRPGNALWATSAAGHGEIGTHLALSPVGGRV